MGAFLCNETVPIDYSLICNFTFQLSYLSDGLVHAFTSFVNLVYGSACKLILRCDLLNNKM